MENPTTIKLEYLEEDAQLNDCKLSSIILANFVNGKNAKKFLNRGKLEDENIINIPMVVTKF